MVQLLFLVDYMLLLVCIVSPCKVIGFLFRSCRIYWLLKVLLFSVRNGHFFVLADVFSAALRVIFRPVFKKLVSLHELLDFEVLLLLIDGVVCFSPGLYFSEPMTVEKMSTPGSLWFLIPPLPERGRNSS